MTTLVLLYVGYNLDLECSLNLVGQNNQQKFCMPRDEHGGDAKT